MPILNLKKNNSGMDVPGNGLEVWNVEDEAANNLEITSYMHSSNDFC